MVEPIFYKDCVYIYLRMHRLVFVRKQYYYEFVPSFEYDDYDDDDYDDDDNMMN